MGMAVASKIRASNVLHRQLLQPCEVRLQHVDLCKQLSEVQLKLKFRVNGLTYDKTETEKGTFVREGLSRRSAKKNCNTACAEGDVLQFELCQPSLVGSSRTVACCAMPFATVLSDIEDGGNGAYSKSFCLELRAKDHPRNVLAHLIAVIRVKPPTLEAVGAAKLPL